MRRLVLFLGLAAAALAGCGKPQPAYDVAYYRANPAARRQEVADCSASPAASTAAECLAAVKAAGEAESQRALPYQPPAGRLNNPGHL